MKYIPLTFHLQTMADLYEQLANLSNYIQASNIVDSLSSNQSTQDEEVKRSYPVTPQKEKAISLKCLQKCKSHKLNDVVKECQDCNEVYVTKVKNQRRTHVKRGYEKKKKRINIKKFKQQKKNKEEINVLIENVSENVSESNSEFNLEIDI